MTTTLKLSGYLAAAATIGWTGGQVQSLTSLTDNEYTSLTDEIDNSTTLYEFADMYLELGSATFTNTDSGIEVYLVPCVDGTNYPTWAENGITDETENALFAVGFIPTTASTAAQKGVLMGIPLPNGKFKFAFRNRGNATLAASGNTVYWRPNSHQSV